MRVLAGYMPPSEGRAIVAGYDVSDQPLEAKLRTGYLPETPPLYPEMTVRDYLTFVARIKGVPRGERQARVSSIMERTRVVRTWLTGIAQSSPRATGSGSGSRRR